MPAPDPEAILSTLEKSVLAAGEIALSFFQDAPETWEKAGGAGPVTEADLAVDAHLKSALLGAHDGFGWLSEESEDDPARLSARDVFIVDPIDGTRSFISGSRTWAISAAYAHAGEVAAAVVHLPARGLTYTAYRGGGAWKNGSALAASRASDPARADVLSAKVNFRAERWRAPPPQPKLAFRSSLAYRMALVAEGRFDAMVTLRNTWEWDVAAGALLVEEAGGALLTAQDAAPRFNTAGAALPGLIAGAPALLECYRAAGPRLPASA